MPDQRAQHADDFRALLVYGCRVEVVDFMIGFRAHIMRQRSGVLGKLRRAQGADIGDAPDRPRTLVGGKLLVAIDRQAFLEAELEPVAAGDAVAGPVVEIFMRDDALDIGEIGVGRGFRTGQDVFVVEDIESLVLHRAHVEVGHGDDVEHIQVIFAAVDELVPAHGVGQRLHRVIGAVLLALSRHKCPVRLCAQRRW